MNNDQINTDEQGVHGSTLQLLQKTQGVPMARIAGSLKLSEKEMEVLLAGNDIHGELLARFAAALSLTVRTVQAFDGRAHVHNSQSDFKLEDNASNHFNTGDVSVTNNTGFTADQVGDLLRAYRTKDEATDEKAAPRKAAGQEK